MQIFYFTAPVIAEFDSLFEVVDDEGFRVDHDASSYRQSAVLCAVNKTKQFCRVIY